MKLFKKILHLVIVFSLTLSSFVQVTSAQTGDFGFDIRQNHKNKEAIEYLHENGVIQGYPDGSFKPDQTVNRVELLKILLEGQGISPDDELYKNCFPDVKEEWFAKYVCYAKEKEYVEGYPDGTFKPDQTVNKVEAVKMLIETQENLKKEIPEAVPEEVYDDTDRKEWYAPYIYVAKEKGLLEETGTTFEPALGMRRAGISENIFRTMKIREEKKMRYEKAQYQELYEEPNYEMLKTQGVPATVNFITPPRQYPKGAQDVSFLDFQIQANTDIVIETLVIGIDAMPTPFLDDESHLIDGSLEKPQANFGDFKIIETQTNTVVFGPKELSKDDPDGKGDLYQIITFNGKWSIAKGTRINFSLTADIADNINIVNTHFFASLPNLNTASRIYDASGNRLTNIFPNKDLKGGLVTVRHDVDLTVKLSESQPESFSIPNYSAQHTFFNLDFTTGPEDAVEIRGLRLSFKESGGFNEFSALYLYEGNTRRTEAAVIDYANNTVDFVSLGSVSSIVVMPGGTRTLSIRGGVGQNPDQSSFQFILPSKGDIRASAPEISGDFPLVGNTFYSTSEGEISEALTISKYDVPFAPQASQINQKVAAFYLTPYGSGLSLKKIALRFGGTVHLDQVINFILYSDSVKLSNAISTVNTAGEDFAVFELETPFPLSSNGKNYPFEVYATIGSNVQAGDLLSFFVNDSADIEVSNADGYGIAAIENNYDNRKWYSDYSSWSMISDSTSVPQDASTPTSQPDSSEDSSKVVFHLNGPENLKVETGANDVTLLDFTIESTKNIEVSKLEFALKETAKKSMEGGFYDESNATVKTNFSDIKLWISRGSEKLTPLAETKELLSYSAPESLYQVVNFSPAVKIEANKKAQMVLTIDIAQNANLDGDTISAELTNLLKSVALYDSATGQQISNIEPKSLFGNAQTIVSSAKSQITSNFLGPEATTVAIDSKDVIFFQFSLMSNTDVEIKKLVFDIGASNVGKESGLLKDLDAPNADGNMYEPNFTNIELRQDFSNTSYSVIGTAELETSAGEDWSQKISFKNGIKMNANETAEYSLLMDVGKNENLAIDGTKILVKLLTLEKNNIIDRKTGQSISEIATPQDLWGNLITIVYGEESRNEISVSLNAKNPSSFTIPKGANNVTFLLYDLENTGNQAIDVTGFTFAHFGSGSLSELEKDLLFENDSNPGTYVIDVRTVDKEKKTYTFEDFRLYLKPGEKITVRVYSDISDSAKTESDHGFELTSLVADAGTKVIGLPIKGNIVIVGENQAGVVIIQPNGTIPKHKAGEKQAKIAEFTMKPINEEAIIKEVVFSIKGSIDHDARKTELANFQLYADSNLVATGDLDANYYHDGLQLKLSPHYKLKADDTATFTLYADIAESASSGDTIEISVWGSYTKVSDTKAYYTFDIDNSAYDGQTAEEKSVSKIE